MAAVATSGWLRVMDGAVRVAILTSMLLLAGCREVIELRVPYGIDYIAYLRFDSSDELIDAGGLIELGGGSLPVFPESDPKLIFIGYPRDAIAKLSPPDRSVLSAAPLLPAGAACEATLGRPAWSSALEAADPVPAVPRLTASWLRDRCACDRIVDAAELTLITHAVPDSAGGRTSPLAVALDARTILFAPGDGRFFLIDSSQLIAAESIPAGAPDHAAHLFPDGRLLLAGSGGRAMIGALGGDIAFTELPPIFGSETGTSSMHLGGELYAARGTGRVSRFTGDAWSPVTGTDFTAADSVLSFAANEHGRTLIASSARRESYAAGRPELIDCDPDFIQLIVPALVRDSGHVDRIAYSPALGYVLAIDDGTSADVYASPYIDAEAGAWSVIHTGPKTGAFAFISALASFEDGVLIGDTQGRLYFADAVSSIRLEDPTLIPRAIVPLRHAFAVISKNDTSEMSVAVYGRSACAGLPAD